MTKTGEHLQVLLINPNPSLSKIVKSIIDSSGFIDITIESSVDNALSLIKSTDFDAIISDYELKDMKGMDILKTIKKNKIDIPFIFHSFSDSLQLIENKETKLSFEFNSEIWKETDDLIQKIIQKVELHRLKRNPELYLTNLDDIIEERITQLKEAQKFVIIGELATMIGHDLRNPLQAITNFLYILTSSISEMSLEEKAVADKYQYSEIFSEIQNEIMYMDNLVSNLHDYAKIVIENNEIIDLSVLINTIFETLVIPEEIQVSMDIEPDLYISGDNASLKHIFSNLFINAIHSMDHGGTLSIHAYRAQKEIYIRIIDTGIGIPLNIQHMIFNPLFTTKSKGTGLGLSVVKRLIEAHQGSIKLIDSSSKGSTFEVKFVSSEYRQEKNLNLEG